MNELGEYLKELRGERSLREVQQGTGISHTYLSTLEKGVDPRNNKPREPSHETLEKLASYYGVPYTVLLIKAGYLGEEEIHEFVTRMANLKDSFGKTAKEIKGTLDIINLKSILIQESELRYDMHNLTDSDRQAIITFIEEILLKSVSDNKRVNKFDF